MRGKDVLRRLSASLTAYASELTLRQAAEMVSGAMGRTVSYETVRADWRYLTVNNGRDGKHQR